MPNMSIQEDVENGNGDINISREDGREPLLMKVNTAEKQSSNLMVYLCTFVAVCGSFEYGCCTGYSSPTQDAITEDLSLSLSQYSMFGSILTFAAMIGAITSGFITDCVGRKGAMRVANSLCVVGWLSIYFAKGVLALYIGRLAQGLGVGVFSYVVPIYIAEIAPKNLRGALTTIHQLMICGGVSTFYIVGTVLTWRALALSGLIPSAVLLFGLFFVPESPRWLAKIGHEKQFESALQTLRGKNTDISHEAADIKDYIEKLEQLPKAKLLDLFQKRYLRSITIGVGLMVVQQFGGMSGICFYLNETFESVGFSATVGTTAYAIIQVVVLVLAAFMIDKFGRKPLFLVSASGLVVACILTAVSFYLKDNKFALSTVQILTVTGLLVRVQESSSFLSPPFHVIKFQVQLYIFSYAIGMGAVPWVIMSEIFPINIKGVAGSLATLVSWFGAWVISYTYNFLLSWSSYGTFILYAAVYAFGIVFVALVVQETKGKTLEQVQADINA